MRTFPKQVWWLVLITALMLCGSPLMVLASGLIGARLAPSESLATLPMGLVVTGLALVALPVSKAIARFGRFKVFVSAAVFSILAALLTCVSLLLESFWLFCLCALLLGACLSAVHQYRFAAMELVAADKIPVVTSVLLLGGLFAAFLGPELAVAGQHLLDVEFAGSFLLLAGVFTVGLVLLLLTVSDSQVAVSKNSAAVNPWQLVSRSRILIVAIATSAVAYAVMSFVMTATPIMMHSHSGHSVESTKLVIQCHIAAMFLPSLFSGVLVSKLGYQKMLWLGVLMFALCLLVSAAGTTVVHFWIALVLLGIAWNFLYVVGTSLLPLGYDAKSSVRVQGANDMVVFSSQAVAALSSGWVLYLWQRPGILAVVVPVLLLYALLLFNSRRYLPA